MMSIINFELGKYKSTQQIRTELEKTATTTNTWNCFQNAVNNRCGNFFKNHAKLRREYHDWL